MLDLDKPISVGILHSFFLQNCIISLARGQFIFVLPPNGTWQNAQNLHMNHFHGSHNKIDEKSNEESFRHSFQIRKLLLSTRYLQVCKIWWIKISEKQRKGMLKFVECQKTKWSIKKQFYTKVLMPIALSY